MTLREEVCLSAAHREDNWWDFVKSMEPPGLAKHVKFSYSMRQGQAKHNAPSLLEGIDER